MTVCALNEHKQSAKPWHTCANLFCCTQYWREEQDQYWAFSSYWDENKAAMPYLLYMDLIVKRHGWMWGQSTNFLLQAFAACLHPYLMNSQTQSPSCSWGVLWIKKGLQSPDVDVNRVELKLNKKHIFYPQSYCLHPDNMSRGVQIPPGDDAV